MTASGIERDFGRLLRRLRGWVARRELAIRAGVSGGQIARLEAGEVVPTLEEAEHPANCLGYTLRIEPQRLFGRSDPEGLPEQLAMTTEERMRSAANLYNAATALRRGAHG